MLLCSKQTITLKTCNLQPPHLIYLNSKIINFLNNIIIFTLQAHSSRWLGKYAAPTCYSSSEYIDRKPMMALLCGYSFDLRESHDQFLVLREEAQKNIYVHPRKKYSCA